MSKKIASKANTTAVAAIEAVVADVNVEAVEAVEAVETVQATETVQAVVAPVVAQVITAPAIVGSRTDKLFDVAGVSNLNGIYKARFANGIKRRKVLRDNGHTDIRLIELPYKMTKPQAVNYLMSLSTSTDENISDELKNYFTDIDAVRAFDDFINGTVPRRVHPVASAVASAVTALTTGVSNTDEPQELAAFDDAFVEA